MSTIIFPNFEEAVLPHLDAAYNLARWLTRNEQDAQDVVQEACLRAFRFFSGFRGGDAACLAPENCPEYLLYLVACKPATARGHRI